MLKKKLKNLNIFLLNSISDKINIKYFLDNIKIIKNYINLNLKLKQKLILYYNISNKQLIYYINLIKNKIGSYELLIIKLLEMKLDNILFRSGFCISINMSNFFIKYKNIFINKILINNNNFILKKKDIIYIKKNIKNYFKKNIINFKFIFYFYKNNFLKICLKFLLIKILYNIKIFNIIYFFNIYNILNYLIYKKFI